MKYISSHDEKEYTVKTNRVKQMTESYIIAFDSYGGYLGIGLITGEITREYTEDGIPQPYTAGTATQEALSVMKEASSTENKHNYLIT